MSTYNEKRQEVIKDLFRGLNVTTSSYSSNLAIDVKHMDNVINQLKKRRPFTKIHVDNKKYENLFRSIKEYDKFMTAAMNLKDFIFEMDLVRTRKYKIFLNEIPMQTTINIINKISERELSMHNILSNVPLNIKYPELWGDYFLKLLGYSIDDNTLFKLLALSNYKRLLTASNKNSLLNELAYLETHRTLSLTDNTAQLPFMLLTTFEGDSFMRFSKCSSVITSIGSETQCCFKKGGVGEPLMLVSLKSPIAAILHGEKVDRTKWFAYIWEMLEYNTETKMFDINLILDNIESNKHLSSQDYDIISDRLIQFNGYKKVYLGYMRNDIYVPQEIKDTVKLKPYHIPFYDKEINRYGHYDDSYKIYTMLERNNDEVNKDFVRKELDLGDFHRIQYIINNKDLDSRITINSESKLASGRITRRFNIFKELDMEKSFIISNKFSIKEYELYDSEGVLYSKFSEGISN